MTYRFHPTISMSLTIASNSCCSTRFCSGKYTWQRRDETVETLERTLQLSIIRPIDAASFRSDVPHECPSFKSRPLAMLTTPRSYLSFTSLCSLICSFHSLNNFFCFKPHIYISILWLMLLMTLIFPPRSV